MIGETWHQHRGPSPSLVPHGDGEDARVVAASLSPTLATVLLDAPDGDFPRTGYLKRAKIFDSALRRGFIERRGYHHGGQWQYQLSAYGAAVRNVLRCRAEVALCGHCDRRAEDPDVRRCTRPNCPLAARRAA